MEVVPVRAPVAAFTPPLTTEVAAPVVAVTAFRFNLRGALRLEAGRDSGEIVTFLAAAGLMVPLVAAVVVLDEAGAFRATVALGVVADAVAPVATGPTTGALTVDEVGADGVTFATGDLGVADVAAEAGTAFFVPIGVRGFAAGLVALVVDMTFVGFTGDPAAGAF